MKTITVLLLLLAGSALADDAGLRRCRGIADPAARLACYDALALPESGAAAVKGEAGKGAQPAAETKAAAAPQQQAQQQFGLEAKAPKEVLQTIESTIPGHFEGWKRRTRITLANGQVWQVNEDSTVDLDLDNPKVTIRRGALGSYFMDFEKDNRSPRVVRVK